MSEVKRYIATQLSPLEDPPLYVYAGLPVHIVVLERQHLSELAAQESKLAAVQAGADRLAEALIAVVTSRDRVTAMDIADQALAAYSETKP